MEKLELKYGCNPNQKPAYISIEGKLPIEILNGRAGYINLLDALNGYKLVKELKVATGHEAATSFKHVSPAGAAIAKPLSDMERKMLFISKKQELSPLASAYARARGVDRMSSFGDFIALSDECDELTALLISKEVSDGVIAPSYSQAALDILRKKRNGNYTIISIDKDYVPPQLETRTVYGITFTQKSNDFLVDDKCFSNIVTRNKTFSGSARLDMTVALIALKYTQSNSVVYAYSGQTIGVGAGQQSRIHCTRLAGDKADLWQLKHYDKVLSLPFKKELSRNEKDNVIEQYLSENPEIDVIKNWHEYFTSPVERIEKEEKREYLESIKGVSLASDAFFPFRDNIDRAYRSGVSYISEPGGSVRDDLVIKAADEYGMTMFFNSMRLFHH